MRSLDRRAAIIAPITDRIGFGCGRLRGGFEERNSRKLIDAALESGIRYFDTAPSYGDGASERILGQGLRHVRPEVQLCTKIGFPRGVEAPVAAALRALIRTAAKPIYRRLMGSGRRDRTAAGARPAALATGAPSEHGRFDLDRLAVGIHESLEALKTDHVDCLMLHEPRLTDPAPSIAATLTRLVSAGTVGRLGVGTGSAIETLPPFGDVAQAALTASLLTAGEARAVIVHGLFRGLSATAFERAASESGLLENIPSLRACLRNATDLSALWLNCVLLGAPVERVLWSTSSERRLRAVLSSVRALHEEMRGAWSESREAMFAQTLRKYCYGVQAAR